MATIEQRISRLESAALDDEIPKSAYIVIWPPADETGAKEARERIQAEADAARIAGKRIIEVNTVDAS